MAGRCEAPMTRKSTPMVAARSTIVAAASWALTSDRKSTRLNSSHLGISYAVFCLKKKNRRDGFCVQWHHPFLPDVAQLYGRTGLDALGLVDSGKGLAHRRARNHSGSFSGGYARAS